MVLAPLAAKFIPFPAGDKGFAADIFRGRIWLGYEATPAEQEKSKEFYDIYWKEYRSVKKNEGAELAELSDYLEDKPAFDKKA